MDAPAQDQAASPVKPGESIAGGKYLIDQVIGVGGMGVVVSALHVKLQQRVAIKFLLTTALRDQESVDRFLCEARSAAALKSEHVARVLDVETLENGAPYIVMEFLDGITLDKFLDRGRLLSIDEAVGYFVQISEAVAEAHAHGIIHRDLKLANLFLTKSADQRPLVKVIDFGLSKETRPNSVRITQELVTLGTPAYMSPEQLRNEDDIDTRADIWALGVVLFELLTSQLPFEAPSVPEICALVVGAPARSPRALRAELPEELAAIVLRCLEKDRSKRYADVAELVEALDPFIPVRIAHEGERIRNVQSARFPTPELLGGMVSASAEKPGTHRGWFLLTGAALVALAIVAVISLVRKPDAAMPVVAGPPAPSQESVPPPEPPAPSSAGSLAISTPPPSAPSAIAAARRPLPRAAPPPRAPARAPTTTAAPANPDSILERR